MSNRRRSERIRVAVPVLLRDAQGEERLWTANASAHGVLAVSDAVRTPEAPVTLEFMLPPPHRCLSMQARVVRTHPDLGPAGLGLDFFAFGRKSMDEWRGFLDRVGLSALGEAPPKASVIEDSPLSASDHATLVLRPGSLREAQDLLEAEVSKGIIRVGAPTWQEVGKRTELVVVHPETRAEWVLEGRVAAAAQRGFGTDRGQQMLVELQLDGGQAAAEGFSRFLASGQGMLEVDVEIEEAFFSEDTHPGFVADLRDEEEADGLGVYEVPSEAGPASELPDAMIVSEERDPSSFRRRVASTTMAGAEKTESDLPAESIDQAILRAKRAHQAVPESVSAIYRLVRLLVKKATPVHDREAQHMLEEILAREPSHPGAHRTYAELLQRQGHEVEAQTHLGWARRMGYGL
jgi:hypothetical protein